MVDEMMVIGEGGCCWDFLKENRGGSGKIIFLINKINIKIV